jgi:hypothetical protein
VTIVFAVDFRRRVEHFREEFRLRLGHVASIHEVASAQNLPAIIRTVAPRSPRDPIDMQAARAIPLYIDMTLVVGEPVAPYLGG